MHNFVMLCKTYSKDIERFRIMTESFNKYNEDNIKMYVSVPETELNLFKTFSSSNIEIITDESYTNKYFTKTNYHNLPVGYLNQEICKLSFWETNLAENYLCVDSDVTFIRKFYYTDFMADNRTPYTVLIMDKDLSIEKHYQNSWESRQNFIKKIYDKIGINDRRLRTCHGMQIMNYIVLKSMKSEFMLKNNYSYFNLLEISPFEFTWYNAWF